MSILLNLMQWYSSNNFMDKTNNKKTYLGSVLPVYLNKKELNAWVCLLSIDNKHT